MSSGKVSGAPPAQDRADIEALRERNAYIELLCEDLRSVREKQWRAERLHHEAEARLAAIHASPAWRATTPFRLAKPALRALKTALMGRVAPSPGSRGLGGLRGREDKNKAPGASSTAPEPPVSQEAPVIYYWVDATVGFDANTGIQRVVRQLARALIEGGFELVPVKWGGLEQPIGPVSAEERDHLALWNGPSAKSWGLHVAPAALRGGGWFIMPELPLHFSDTEQKALRAAAKAAGLNTAAVFYDAIPWTMRDIYPPAFSAAHRDYMRELANYDVVLAISEYSRSELMRVLAEEFGLATADLGHIRACLLPAEFPEPEAPVASEPRAEGAVEILSVGTLEPRKNQERLLDAFSLAQRRAHTPLRLTLAGGSHGFDRDLVDRFRHRVAELPQVRWEERADDARIMALYAACDFTVYPSLQEGFGMPILESLWCGKPVICSDGGAMREVAEAGGCLMADMTDVVAIAAAIVRLADDTGLRQRLAEDGPKRQFRLWRDYGNDVAAQLGLSDQARKINGSGAPEP